MLTGRRERILIFNKEPIEFQVWVGDDLLFIVQNFLSIFVKLTELLYIYISGKLSMSSGVYLLQLSFTRFISHDLMKGVWLQVFLVSLREGYNRKDRVPVHFSAA